MKLQQFDVVVPINERATMTPLQDAVSPKIGRCQQKRWAKAVGQHERNLPNWPATTLQVE